MSGGEKQRDPLLFPYLGLTRKIRHTTLPPVVISFTGAAASNKNKRPVNMRPEATKNRIAHLGFVVNTRPATGLIKAKAAKKKEAPIKHHIDAPPKIGNSRRFLWLLFLSAVSLFFKRR